MKEPLELWYDSPAESWESALPVGNGALGAMIYGGVYQEKWQVNEESLWYGKPVNRNNPDGAAHLPRIRFLIEQGRLGEAEELARYALAGIPDSQRCYQSLGELLLAFPGQGDSFQGYRRSLDLSRAVSIVDYRSGGAAFRREIFCSYPAGVLVMRISSDRKGAVNLNILLRRSDYLQNPAAQRNSSMCLYGTSKYFDRVSRIGDSQLVLTGDNGIRFAMTVKADAVGGSCGIIGEHLLIRSADEAVLYFAASTSFKEEAYEPFCVRQAQNAPERGYAALLEEHIRDYQSLFSRFSVAFPQGDGFDTLPSDVRQGRFDGVKDIRFWAVYLQYCRYLMISSSRKGGLPANLQGVWCQDFASAWDSKYTININLQMNYWPVFTANLGECAAPLNSFIGRLAENGRETAAVMYGCSGSVAHHNSDLYADSAPQDLVSGSTFWCFGLAWLALHLYEQYLFTENLEFLREQYPILRQAALFFAEYLYEDETGVLASCPSSSPENVFIKEGKGYSLTKSCAMDFEILTELFHACSASCAILHVDSDFAAKLAALLLKFPKPRIGSRGQLLEWREEYGELDPGHRHFSHLFALCPGASFTAGETPELCEAARRSIELRLREGGSQPGWSRAWAANLYARLRDADAAYNQLCGLLGDCTQKNLLNSNPPFQIDGNFGALACFCEMLAQSHGNRIVLLPALPEAYKDITVEGLRLRGNLEVDMEVSAGKLTRCRFHSKRARRILFTYEKQAFQMELKADIPAEWVNQNILYPAGN